VFENRVLRRIFGLKGDKVTGGWRKLYSAEFHNLYSSPNIINVIKLKRMRWARHVAHVEMRNMCKILIGTPEGMIPLERPRSRWKDNIKINLKRIGWEVWTGLIWLSFGNR
jgi:hypothetical protein